MLRDQSVSNKIIDGQGNQIYVSQTDPVLGRLIVSGPGQQATNVPVFQDIFFLICRSKRS
jgi:hypothetical protein